MSMVRRIQGVGKMSELRCVYLINEIENVLDLNIIPKYKELIIKGIIEDWRTYSD